MRIVFLGTPEFAIRPLQALLSSHHEVLAVVCQPDRERDKKGNIIFPPTKQCALQHGVPVFQFFSIKNEGVRILTELKPDIMVTAAYGQILSAEVLSIAKHGTINVHASLLPKYRGSSPIQHAVIDGEAETGITIMQTALGLDTGDIISQAKTKIKEGETAGELSARLSQIGADLLLETLDQIQQGTAIFTPQDELQATKCPLIKKSDGKIDWNKPAVKLASFIHGNNPWPLAHSYINQKRISIYRAEPFKNPPSPESQSTKPASFSELQPTKAYSAGEVIEHGTDFLVAAGEGTVLKLIEAQAEGKNRMAAPELLKGLRLGGKGKFSNER